MKVHVETWGCQMNAADSEKMLAILAARHYSLAGAAEDADLVLLNTCHIREKARHKVVSRLGVLRKLKEQKPGMRIAVAGCVAQAEGARLLKEAPEIDVLFGPGKIEELPRLLDQREQTGKSAMAVGFKRGDAHTAPAEPGHDDHAAIGALDGTASVARPRHPQRPEGASGDLRAPPSLSGKNEVSRYVNIQQGCNNYCTFCVVPFTRGREVSRTEAEIVRETEALVAAGAREITLLGQNVNSYGSDVGSDFETLLRRVVAVPGLERLRFTTSNPHDFTPGLARLFRDEPKLGRYLHLPVQSGSDSTLLRMKRKVTVAEYRERLAWLHEALPDIALSTDLIVGFPGETDEEFEDTLKLVAEARFSFSFTFKYSPRKNTPAARFTDQVPEAVKDERLARLNALQDSLTIQHQKAEIGQTRPVLFHYESKKDPGHYYGRTEHFRLVRVKAELDLVGSTAPVKIIDGNKTALIGTLA